MDGNLLLGVIALCAVVATLLGMASVWLATRPATVPGTDDFTPPITIFKPLKGLDEELEANLRSFFQLDYPRHQLLFGVADKNDPAVVVVNRLIDEFPDRDARLIIGGPTLGYNPKVGNLIAMDRFRKHDILLISDSNVRARPSYLKETVCYLKNPSVGLVTNLFAGVGEQALGGKLENLHLNGYIAAGVALAKMFGCTCVVGKSMMMRGQALEAIGGFASVRNLLAEDQVIGMKTRKAGYSIKLSHHVVENVNQVRGLSWFLNRHSRWFKIRRRLALPAFLFEPFANLGIIGVVWALSGDSGIAWGGLVGLVGLGIARDALQSKRLRGEFPAFRTLLLSPVKDLFLLPIWFDALVNQRVQWRGHRLLVSRWTRLHAPRGDMRRLRRRLRQQKQNRKARLRLQRSEGV